MNDVPDIPSALSPDELAGQLRDVILDHVQKLRTPWASLPAAEQKAYIKTVSDNAVQLIDGCLDCMLAEGGTTLDAACHDVRIKKDSIMATISIDRGEQFAELLQKAAHKPVKIAFAAHRDKLVSLGKVPEADADQPEIFKDDDDVIGRPTSAPMLPSPMATKPKTTRRQSTNGRRRKTAPKATMELA